MIKNLVWLKKLAVKDRRSYLKSKEQFVLPIPFHPENSRFLLQLEEALTAKNQALVRLSAQRLSHHLNQLLGVKFVELEILEKRPSNSRGELHGLYQAGGKLAVPRIRLWMRTAKRLQVVAFKTFLRTFIHEHLHHWDYHLLKLSNSYHTEGFYRRESDVLKQCYEWMGL